MYFFYLDFTFNKLDKNRCRKRGNQKINQLNQTIDKEKIKTFDKLFQTKKYRLYK